MNTSKNFAKNIIGLIGNTPLVELNNFFHSNSKIFAKLEMFNPTGSIKDRIALNIINVAEKKGILREAATIVEASSGNTGASIAFLAKLKGYKCIISVPEKTSSEKINIIKALGAQVIICPNTSSDDSEHYINQAKKIHETIKNSFLVDQYNNPENINIHYKTTGPEIWKQMKGRIEYFFASAGSGGTISGIGRYLKKKNPAIKVILTDPVGSVFYDYFKTGHINKNNIQNYIIEGVGKDVICSCLDFSVIDDVIQFTDDEAIDMCKTVANSFGFLVGGSSGGILAAAAKVIHKIKEESNAVLIFPDTGFKYMNKIWDIK